MATGDNNLIIEAAYEMARIAKGLQPAARITMHGQVYVPEGLLKAAESERDTLLEKLTAAERERDELLAALKPFVERIPKAAWRLDDEAMVATAGIELRYFREARRLTDRRFRAKQDAALRDAGKEK